MLRLLLLFAAASAQTCGTDPDAPNCSAGEDCCKDGPSCTGVCSECCVRQSTFCVAPRAGFVTSTCCPRWTVSCSVGSVGCCDPATPWQLLGSGASAAAAPSSSSSSFLKAIGRKPSLVKVVHMAEVLRGTLLAKCASDTNCTLPCPFGERNTCVGGACECAHPHPHPQPQPRSDEAGFEAYALFPQPFGKSFNVLTIDVATGNTTKKAVTGPAAKYYGRYYGESSRVFPFDPKTGRFVFADIDLTNKATSAANHTLTVYTISPSTGVSTESTVTTGDAACLAGGYPYGLQFDDTAGQLVVGLQTASEATFCGIDPDAGHATLLSTVKRTSVESDPSFYAAFMTRVHSSKAFRIGHKTVSTAASPGYSVTDFAATTGENREKGEKGEKEATTEWRSVPLEATHGLPSTIQVHPQGGYVSLAPRADGSGSLDAVKWDDTTGEAVMVGNFTNAYMPSLSGKPLGYVADGVAGSLFAAMTVAIHPNPIFPGVGDRWVLATVDLGTGVVREMPLTPQPSFEGAETVGLSGFGIRTVQSAGDL